jgi:Gpi18-like mannosyltransferase
MDFSKKALAFTQTKIFRSVLALLAALLFFVVITQLEPIKQLGDDYIIVCALYSLLYFCVCLIFALNKKIEFVALGFFAAMAAALVVIRVLMLFKESGDYAYFLHPWCEALGQAEGAGGLSEDLGDYNVPYMYFLLIISKLPIKDLYLIKFVSVIFDVVLAYFVMKIVSLKTNSANTKIFAFLLTLAIPTVILNSSYWAQCDGIFTAFCIGAVYFALKGKEISAYAFLALAISFKLQAIFIFPFFIALIILKKIRLVHSWAFIAVFFATILPALIAGRPIDSILSIYYEQVGQYSYLTAGSPNLYGLMSASASFDHFSLIGTFLTGCIVMAVLYFVYIHRTYQWQTKDYVLLAFLFAMIMPYFLPQMHERYFFMADVLSVVWMFYNRKRWYIPVMVIFCSYNAYQGFLFGQATFLSTAYLSLINLAVILISARDLVLQVNSNDKIKKQPDNKAVFVKK